LPLALARGIFKVVKTASNIFFTIYLQLNEFIKQLQINYNKKIFLSIAPGFSQGIRKYIRLGFSPIFITP